MEAAQKYSLYLQSHIENVAKAYSLLLPFTQRIGLSESDFQQLKENIKNHDKSKFLEDEFVPYSNYFYGKKTDESIKNFKVAVKLHKERNPHHHEFWRGREIPLIYIIEMVCDWWAFSLQKHNPLEIFDWYNENKTKLNLSAGNQQ